MKHKKHSFLYIFTAQSVQMFNLPLQALFSMAGGGFGVGGLEPALQKSLLVSRRIGNTLFVAVRQSVPQPNNVSGFPVRDARPFPQLDKISGQVHHSVESWSPVWSSAHLTRRKKIS